MSKGYSGLFSDTKGSRVTFGSTDYMKPTDDFSIFIKRRKDIDANGFYDIIAHGNPVSIEIQQNGIMEDCLENGLQQKQYLMLL